MPRFRQRTWHVPSSPASPTELEPEVLTHYSYLSDLQHGPRDAADGQAPEKTHPAISSPEGETPPLTPALSVSTLSHSSSTSSSTSSNQESGDERGSKCLSQRGGQGPGGVAQGGARETGTMVRFGRLSSCHSWDLLQFIPEDPSEKGGGSPQNLPPAHFQARLPFPYSPYKRQDPPVAMTSGSPAQ
ncbi:hypothetical protein JZ751_023939 [Albula glossodonta]|uniref:Uncharacterized protein n=1 Tax=Albula glossodonta TaxID=121402 RepID=A0A8T2NFC9_9TELE|nr:hypothetical protein JZ751_023939 [Albula glossodonta]